MKIFAILLLSFLMFSCFKESAALYQYFEFGIREEVVVRFYHEEVERALENCNKYRKIYCTCKATPYPPICDPSELNTCNAVCKIDKNTMLKIFQ